MKTPGGIRDALKTKERFIPAGPVLACALPRPPRQADRTAG
jgi:hypothetical protein